MNRTQLKMARVHQASYEAKFAPRLRDRINAIVEDPDYENLITDHHIQDMPALLALIDKAITEGNSILIEPEYCGHAVLIWKAPQSLES